MFKFNQKKLVIMIIVVIVISSVNLIYFLHINPVLNKINHLEAKVQTKNKIIEEAQDFKQSTLSDKGTKRDNKINLKIPEEVDLTGFLKKLGTLVEKIDINFRPKELIKTKEYIQVPILLTFSADYVIVKDFFIKLSNLNRLVRISDLQISKGEGQNLEVNTLINIYSMNSGRERENEIEVN